MREVEVKIANVATREKVRDIFACERDPVWQDCVEEIVAILKEEYGPDWEIRNVRYIDIAPNPDDDETKILTTPVA